MDLSEIYELEKQLEMHHPKASEIRKIRENVLKKKSWVELKERKKKEAEKKK